MSVFDRFVYELDIQVKFAADHPHIPRDVYHALSTVLEAATAAARTTETEKE